MASASAPERILQRLDWQVVRRLDGMLQGDYRSLFHGSGLDFAALREYQFGDDVRAIDWNVTARMDTPYVREYHEDREVTAWFLLDLSPSIDFGSETKKRSLSTEFITVLARLLTRQGNRVGALFYGDKVDTVIPARGGRRHVLGLLHRLLQRKEMPKSDGTDLRAFLRVAFQSIPRRSMVFIVSDFFSKPGWAEPLAHLARRHEVVAVRLYDPLERELPDMGMLVMQDSETGEQLFVDTHDKGFRKRFASVAERRERELRTALARAGVDCLELATDGNLVDALMRFTDLRKRRSRLAGGGRHAAGGVLPGHLEKVA